jgi:acetyl esterase/lipase
MSHPDATGGICISGYQSQPRKFRHGMVIDDVGAGGQGGGAAVFDRLVDDKWPRSYGIHEKGDPVVPVAGVEALAAAVRAKGIPMELRLEEGNVHGFGWNRPGSKEKPRATSDWLPKVTDWILEGDAGEKSK